MTYQLTKVLLEDADRIRESRNVAMDGVPRIGETVRFGPGLYLVEAVRWEPDELERYKPCVVLGRRIEWMEKTS